MKTNNISTEIRVVLDIPSIWPQDYATHRPGVKFEFFRPEEGPRFGSSLWPTNRNQTESGANMNKLGDKKHESFLWFTLDWLSN